MKAWEVIGIETDGEPVCPDCYTEKERLVANDQAEDDDITPIFAIEALEDLTCGRCNSKIEGE